MDEAQGPPVVQQRSVVAAPVEVVWERVVSPEGINHELAPLLRMTVPAAAKGRSIAQFAAGDRVGRSWLLALRLMPIDFDDIRLAELDPGRRFLEDSRMLSMRRWRHERTLTPVAGGTAVQDCIWFEPRAPLQCVPVFERAMRSGIAALFRHRHRRLRRYFGPQRTHGMRRADGRGRRE